MTEVDIWIEAFRILNMTFIDEECHGLNNRLKYEWDDYLITLSFDRKNEKVYRLGMLGKFTGELFDLEDRHKTRKEEFEKKHKQIFRQAKLNLMLK